MWMINDVDPLAAIRRRVWKLSRSVATKASVPMGHQPGNGNWKCCTEAPASAAPSATQHTKSRILNSLDIGREGGNPVPTYLVLAPGRAFSLAEHASNEVGHSREPADFQHERHLPGKRTNFGKGRSRYDPPDAPLINCPLVSARYHTHCHNPRRPGSPCLYFPFYLMVCPLLPAPRP